MSTKESLFQHLFDKIKDKPWYMDFGEGVLLLTVDDMGLEELSGLIPENYSCGLSKVQSYKFCITYTDKEECKTLEEWRSRYSLPYEELQRLDLEYKPNSKVMAGNPNYHTQFYNHKFKPEQDK